MRHRRAVLTATALIGSLTLGPMASSAAAQFQPQTPGLTLPAVSGSLARGGQFSGSLTITRLMNQAGQLVADGMIVGSVTAESSAATTSTPTAVGTPASSGTIFASTSTPLATSEAVASTVTPAANATSTPAPTSETVSATSTPAATATSTATPTATVAVGAMSTTTPASDDFFPRASLDQDRSYQIAQPAAVSQSFREIPLTLADPDMGACDVLHVDLGVVFIDQLGVQLDLAPAVIDLATMPRANRPLGGLLCTVASLLDLGPSSTQAATVNELLPIVNRALSTASR